MMKRSVFLYLILCVGVGFFSLNARRINVAIFGFGRAGKIHYRNLNLNKKFKISYIVETPKNVEAALNFLKDNPTTDAVEVLSSEWDAKIFEDPSVDALFICSPSNLHFEQIRCGLMAGKHIFCEKPIAVNKSGIKEVYQLAEERGLYLFCAFNRRFDPYFKDVKKIVDKGKLGKVNRMMSISRDYPFPSKGFLKKSGGIFHDSGIYDIDLMNWILGARPVSVFVQGSHLMGNTEYDFEDAVIVLEYPNEVMGTINLSRNSTNYDQRIEVYGSEKEVQVSNPFVWPVVLAGSAVEQEFYSFSRRYHASYVAELEHFRRLIRGKIKEERTVTKEDVLNSFCIAQACQESVDRKEKVTIAYDN